MQMKKKCDFEKDGLCTLKDIDGYKCPYAIGKGVLKKCGLVKNESD